MLMTNSILFVFENLYFLKVCPILLVLPSSVFQNFKIHLITIYRNDIKVNPIFRKTAKPILLFFKRTLKCSNNTNRFITDTLVQFFRTKNYLTVEKNWRLHN